jgi:hypothetical protein
VDEQPKFPSDFDNVFEVGAVAGNPAYFGLNVLQGLVDGIRDFTEVRQERWRRRYRSLGTALIASSMWIDDKELIDAIGAAGSGKHHRDKARSPTGRCSQARTIGRTQRPNSGHADPSLLRAERARPDGRWSASADRAV